MRTSLRLGSGLLGLVLSVCSPLWAAAPVLQKSDAIAVQLGQPVDYHVVATGGVTSFTAHGLPNGVAINATTGEIAGTPTDVATYTIGVNAANADGTSAMTLTVSVVSPSAAPLIYAPLTFDAYNTAQQGGSTFSCTLKATGSPTSFQTSDPLPANWTFIGSTISGPTTQPGLHMVPVNATNQYGVGSAAVTIRVHPACTGMQQTTGTLTAGQTFVVTLQFNRPLSFSGTAPYLQLFTSDGSVRTLQYVSGNGTSNFQFAYTITPTDAAGDIVLNTAVQPASGGAVAALTDSDGLSVGSSLPISGPYLPSAKIAIVAAPAPAPTASPTVAAAPTTTTSPSANTVVVTTAAPTSPSSGTAVASTTSAPSAPATSSTPTPVATAKPTTTAVTPAPTPTGGPAVALAPAPTAATTTAQPAGKLVNLSARAVVADGDPSRAFIAGFVVAGSTPKQMLVRAVGPSLSGFGVSNSLSNPVLKVFDSTGATVAQNDDWSGSDVAAAAVATGAFGLNAGSHDAAMLVTLPPGVYSMQVVPNGGSGTALAEIYDTTASSCAAPLINLSMRGFVGSGDGALTAGFVVSGSGPKRVLIRGIGPALANYGVAGALADPVVKVYQNGQVVAQNDNWGSGQSVGGNTAASASDIATAASTAGAFPLASGSGDAAVIVTLPPGSYSAVVSSANGGTGAAMVEVYELP